MAVQGERCFESAKDNKLKAFRRLLRYFISVRRSKEVDLTVASGGLDRNFIKELIYH